MKTLKAFGKVLLWVLAALLVLVLVVLGLRAFNGHEYPITSLNDESFSDDKSSYATSDRIAAIEGKYLNGFHFRPEEKKHKGVIVVYGGSEGSPDYDRASALADDGYEVLSLFFFGQPNQAPSLANVPLDQFDEVRDYIKENAEDEGPVTVIGTSKGAEFAELLAAKGFAVDNVVAFAPGHYSYSGLDFSSGEDLPSFTSRGKPVEWASFRKASITAGAKVMWDMATKYPVSYRSTYESAAKNSDDSARINLSNFDGNVLLFGGEDDQMWQSDVAARALAEQGGNIEAHVYPRAGHIFAYFPNSEEMPNGWQIMFGGTAEGNRAAHDDTERILRERLAQWHG
ncbi:acyl-CoA thioester hydrolase/BAAT C-terminal domain-containing protein [Corynebacterium sp. P3-F1]|uniref:dienelactone hydrolase family protein n=1 Tax=Corynebacterium sp. P3-F1 TaxID=3059080 RepID=UPI00265CCA47|nr:acyl-CoA thioester hydrolase/BAAT C-terminal domain-containing protein [Corynebacterium sp. P3-F1]WKK62022.1 acyl-CoA thioester hydrolase/BAAT C-terminal domain-containing protein [Corynebacterium sp. P3-F1]